MPIGIPEGIAIGSALLSGLGGLFSGKSGGEKRQEQLFDSVIRQLYDANYVPDWIAKGGPEAINNWRNNPLVKAARQGFGAQSTIFDAANAGANRVGDPFARPETGFKGIGYFNPSSGGGFFSGGGGGGGSSQPFPQSPARTGPVPPAGSNIFSGNVDTGYGDVAGNPIPPETLPPQRRPPPMVTGYWNDINMMAPAFSAATRGGIVPAGGLALKPGEDYIVNSPDLPASAGNFAGGYEPPQDYGGVTGNKDIYEGPAGQMTSPDLPGSGNRGGPGGYDPGYDPYPQTGYPPSGNASDTGGILTGEPSGYNPTDPQNGGGMYTGPDLPPGFTGNIPGIEGFNPNLSEYGYFGGNTTPGLNRGIEDVAMKGLYSGTEFGGVQDELASQIMARVNENAAARGAFGGSANRNSLTRGLGSLGLDIMNTANANRSRAIADARGVSGDLYGQAANTYGLNVGTRGRMFDESLAGYGANLGAQGQAYGQAQDTFRTNTDLYFRNLAAQQEMEDRAYQRQQDPYKWLAHMISTGQGAYQSA